MTTETTGIRRTGSTRVLLRSAAVGLVAGLLVAAAGALLEGRPAGLGALVGTGVAVLLLWGGAVVVDLVAGVMPSAALLVAMTTYAAQVAALVLAFVVLSRSGLLGSTLDRVWLGAALAVVAGLWTVAQIVLTVRRRIPVFDLLTGGHR